MPLPTNLNTNEVKNASGTEIEFLFREEVGRRRDYAKSGEIPALPFRLRVQHEEIGKEGPGLVRRSNVSVTKKVASGVDSSITVKIGASLTLLVPVGHLLTLDDVKEVLAALISFVASTGADTTIKYDCTGNGASALLNGTL